MSEYVRLQGRFQEWTESGVFAKILAGLAKDLKERGGSYKALTGRTAETVKQGLEAADMPYRDGSESILNFHSFRGECATLLFHAGILLKLR